MRGDRWRNVVTVGVLGLYAVSMFSMSGRNSYREPALDTILPENLVHCSTERSAEQKVSSGTKTVKYTTYSRFGGRINNQWFQLVAALQLSTLLDRTLLVPPEVRPVDWTGMFKPELGWWDLSELYEHYRLEYKEKEPDVPKECKLTPRQYIDLFPGLDTSRWDRCPILHIGGNGGLLMCGQHQFCGNEDQQRLVYDIYSRFKPGPMLKAILPKEHFRTSVHSRTHGGEGVGSGDASLCLDGVERTAKDHLKHYNLKELQGQCRLNETITVAGRFLLASDGVLDWSRWDDQKVLVSDALDDKGEIGKKDGVLAALVELFSLVSADYFYGNIYSTFSLSVCMLRGLTRTRDSNVCWILMHPGKKYAEPPNSPPERVGCIVPLGDFDKKVYETIKMTWGKRCDLLRFMTDPSVGDKREYHDDIVEVPMARKFGSQICSDGEPCKHIWEKVWRMWIWTADNVLDKADWFLKVDSDTFLIPENVRKFVRHLLPEDDLYTGHLLYHREPLMIAGTATLFSRGTIRKLADVYRNMPSEGDAFEDGRCVDRAGATEERSTAVCASIFGVPPTPCRDEKGGEKFLLFQPHGHLGMNRTAKNTNDWYWSGKPSSVGHGVTCCSEEPIAIHGNKEPQLMKTIEKDLYGDVDDLKVEVEKDHYLYANYVLQRDWYRRVRRHGVDRELRVLVAMPGSGSKLLAVQVYMALFYMWCDAPDCVCKPDKLLGWGGDHIKSSKDMGKLDTSADINLDGLSEPERWALYRQPWFTYGVYNGWGHKSKEDAQKAADSMFHKMFPSIRPYRVVTIKRDEHDLVSEAKDVTESSNDDFDPEGLKVFYRSHRAALKRHLVDNVLTISYTDLADSLRCPEALRDALDHWHLPYRWKGLERACHETRKGQMSQAVKRFLAAKNKMKAT